MCRSMRGKALSQSTSQLSSSLSSCSWKATVPSGQHALAFHRPGRVSQGRAGPGRAGQGRAEQDGAGGRRRAMGRGQGGAGQNQTYIAHGIVTSGSLGAHHCFSAHALETNSVVVHAGKLAPMTLLSVASVLLLGVMKMIRGQKAMEQGRVRW